MNTTEKLRQVFAQSLAIAPEHIGDDLRYGGIAEWDSVAHMALVAAIEAEFDIMLDTEDVIDMASFARARELLGKYGVVDTAA